MEPFSIRFFFSHPLPKPQPGVFYKPTHPIIYPKAKKVISKLIFWRRLFGFDIASEKKVVFEKGQFIIIFYRAYLLYFIVDFRNGSLKKMAMIHHENSEMIEQINF